MKDYQCFFQVHRTDEWRTRVMVILALHREVAMHNIYIEEQKFSDKVCKYFAFFNAYSTIMAVFVSK